MLIIPFFIKHDASHLTVLLVYIDDIVLAGDNINEINRVKVILDRQFRINDLGPLRYFLGLEAARSTTGYCTKPTKLHSEFTKQHKHVDI